MKTVLILDNIRSNENVGSIFRTADATSVHKIFLVGVTPAPLDRFGRENKGLSKASLGAEKSVDWEKCETVVGVIQKLKDDNYKVVAVEQSEKSVDYKTIKDYRLKVENHNLALIFGNEVSGISKEVLAECDLIAQIPMLGKKESLNVAVSVGVVLYSLID